MACADFNSIAAQLWPDRGDSSAGIWAILDPARNNRIFGAIRASDLERCCLYTAPQPALERVAPHLLRLQDNHQFTRCLIEEGWGDSWGVFLQSDAGLEKLRIHLKHFLRVQDEQGKRLIFRFYDPRVLRVYLPTCTAEELWAFFGPIRRFVMEGEDPATLVSFAFAGGKLIESRVRIAKEVKAQEDAHRKAFLTGNA